MTMNTLLDEALEAWEDARNGVIDEVQNVPADQFDFRPADGTRSVTELVVHIMEVPLMMVGELTRPDTNLKRWPWQKMLSHYAGHVRNLRTKRELIAALKRTLKEGTAKFREAGELHMLGRIERFDGELGTRLAWLHHGIAHEMYHRGQLAVYQRLMGLTPALTQRIGG
jgi:uncharacterized damage-inducible protein DinB